MKEKLFRYFIDELGVNPRSRNFAGQSIISVIFLNQHFTEKGEDGYEEYEYGHNKNINKEQSQRLIVIKYLIEEKKVSWHQQDNREIGAEDVDADKRSDTIKYLLEVAKEDNNSNTI